MLFCCSSKEEKTFRTRDFDHSVEPVEILLQANGKENMSLVDSKQPALAAIPHAAWRDLYSPRWEEEYASAGKFGRAVESSNGRKMWTVHINRSVRELVAYCNGTFQP